MEIYILNKDFETIDLIDDFKSLIWRRKYFACGEFSLYITADKFNVLSEAVYICKSDSDELGIIENIELEDSDFTVRGRFARALLERRVVYPTVKAQNKFVGQIMKELVTQKLGIGIGNVVDGSKIITQKTGGNLMEWFDELTAGQGLSYDIIYDYANNCLSFEMRQGRDLRQAQSVNNPVIFSPDWDNLNSFKYNRSDKDFKNFCFIAGAGEGENRRMVYIDLRSSGEEEIRELWVDARDLQPDDLTDEDYGYMLMQRGSEKMAKYAKVECFTADVSADSYVYREDYDLGDIVNVSVPKRNLYADLRITEIEEVYEQGARSLFLTFGQGFLSVPDYLKRELK